MRLLNCSAALFALLLSLSASAPAAPNMEDKAPDFKAIDQNGKLWQFATRPETNNYTVIYFYSGAMSGDCNKQVGSFRDRAGTTIDLGVIGISGDTPANLKLFEKVHALNFPLLSDPAGMLAKQFGVPFQSGERTITRQIDGKPVKLERSITIAMWVFVLDREGKIIYRNTDVRADVDLNTIVEFIRKREGK